MKVGFIGLGKLGRDAAEVLAEKHDVTGYDPNIDVPGLSGTQEQACKGKDVVLIAVQTPHIPAYDGKDPTSHLPPRDFDYSYIIEATKQVDALVDKGTLISVISTMLPGTVRKEIQPLVQNGQFIYNPYLIAQGTVKWDMRNPEMIMIGTEDGEESLAVDMLHDLYNPILEKEVRYELGTWEEIEALKVFYNTFISTKLALVNMIQDTAMNVGHMNVDVVTKALANSTQRIMGPSYMKAGFGDGGGCHPRDNIALRVLNERYDYGYDLFDAIMKAREEQARNMAKYCVSFKMPVVILGRGFKPGVEQTAGSPSLLVGWYVTKLTTNKVYYDHAPDEGAYTFLIHDKAMIPKEWNPGSCIIDPYRELGPVKNCVVKHYGNTRR
tara:strand:+ start:10688 stop:11833 length:1146 start_codon:yes stop_codon:yes gene_type:complete